MYRLREIIQIYLEERFHWEQRTTPILREEEIEKFYKLYVEYIEGETEKFALELLQNDIDSYYGLEKEEKKSDHLYDIYLKY